MTARSPFVVVIDRYPDTVEMLVAALSLDGMQAFGTSDDDPVAVETFVAQHDPSVVIYDVQPPYGHSVAAFRHLRRALPNVPVIITTTDGHRLDGTFDEDEVQDVVLKPCNLARLLDEVRSLAAPV